MTYAALRTDAPGNVDGGADIRRRGVWAEAPETKEDCGASVGLVRSVSLYKFSIKES